MTRPLSFYPSWKFPFILGLTVLVCICSGSGAAVGSLAPTYTQTDLGTLGGAVSWAFDINEAGTVVGWSTTATGDTLAFIWREGSMASLGTLGGNFSQALRINHRGDVVGQSSTGSGDRHGFVWRDGVMMDLGAPDSYSSAHDISDMGQIVGYGFVGGGNHGLSWQGGAIEDLGPGLVPTSLNNRGQIVGHIPGTFHAFSWQNGDVTDLGPSGAFDINSRGEIVGWNVEIPAGGFYAPGIWKDGTFTPLDGVGGGLALAINDAGQIAGTRVKENLYFSAFIWEAGDWVALEDDTDSQAWGINARAEAVGYYVTSSGEGHAALWQPAHTPSSTARSGQASRGLPSANYSTLDPITGSLRVSSAPGALPIRFALSSELHGSYHATVYDVQGRRVASWEGVAVPGRGGEWNGRTQGDAQVSPGIYYLSVEVNGHRFAAKMVVAR